MSLLSWPVLLGAAVLGSPAMWGMWVSGTLSPDAGGMRLLICLFGSWAVMSLVARLAGDPAERGPADAVPVREMQRPADVDLD